MSNRRSRILVVDDNPATHYSTARVLRSAGFDTVPAITGTEALAHSHLDVDLIILDVNLPDIDGFEVARRLRLDPVTSHLPIVHLSATLIGELDRAQGLESGSDSYLTHPVEPTVLVGTVKAFLRARRAEEAVRASEARFRGVFDHALNGIMLVEPSGLCVEANPAMCTMLARSREDLVGRVSDFMHVIALTEVHAIRAAIDRDREWRGCLPMRRGDNEVVEIEWHISCPPGTDLRIAIASDVSERNRLEREREAIIERERAARAEAERINLIKDEFLATLSHELRNPLNAIVGWSNVLMRSDMPKRLEEAVRAIDRNARMQAQLISDLLDVSRIASGKLDLEIAGLQLNLTIEAAIQSVGPVAHAKDVRIEFAGGQEITIDGDGARLQQVFWNLLSNAVKFTPAGGVIRVSLERDDVDVRVVVADTGKGISAEFLPHIFERFRQEQSDTRKSYSGLGLGLAIAQHLVTLHGGRIDASSEGEGKGATFTVRLPAGCKTKRVPSMTPAASVHTRLDGLRVLVVDDDADTRALMRRLLGDAGAEVAESDDVERALSAVDDFQPQILVSDIGMAVHNGYDLIQKIRQTHSDVRLPAIAVTAFARAEDRRMALQAGFQEHLTKPIDAQQMLTLVAALSRTLKSPEPDLPPGQVSG